MARTSGVRRRPDALLALLAALSAPAPAAGVAPEAPPSGSTRLAEHGQPPLPSALDHVSVAVSDLGAAGRAWRALGFVLKPGRVHANSIENLHAKFPDGTEIELITATEPRDSLAAEYLRLAAEGDGGAFAAIRVEDLGAVRDRLRERGAPVRMSGDGSPASLLFARDHPCRPLWFFEVPAPWIDAEKYFRHPNGATRLVAVWVAEEPPDAMARAIMALTRSASWPTWGSESGARMDLDLGTAIYLRRAEVPVRGRGIVGATVSVEDLDRTRGVLRAAGIGAEEHSDPRGASLLVGPKDATGIWLEFLEPADRR